VWEASDHEAGKIPENSPKKPKAQRHKPKHSPADVLINVTQQIAMFAPFSSLSCPETGKTK